MSVLVVQHRNKGLPTLNEGLESLDYGLEGRWNGHELGVLEDN